MNSKWLSALVPLAIFLVLVVVLWRAIGKDPTELESVLIDQPLPEFELTSLQDPDRILRNADMPREPWLLNVWGTWCPSCYLEHPYLMKIADEQRIPMMGVNYKDDRGKAQEYLVQYGDPFVETLYDGSGRFGIDLGVYGAPETYLIDSKGNIRYRRVGEMNDRIWKSEFEPRIKALKEAP